MTIFINSVNIYTYMLKIRLQRTGKRHDPSYRVVLTDSKNGPKSGRSQEILGNYNAQKGEPQLKGERINYWLSVGAQASDTAHNLFVKEGIIKDKKRDVLSHTKIQKKLDERKPAEPEVKKEVSAEPVVEIPAEEATAPAEAETPVESEAKEEKVNPEAEEEVKEEAPAEETKVE